MSNATPEILKRTFRLHSWEVDQRGMAKPDILFSFMLDSAWAHADKSEFSYDALRDEGQLWVLSRFLAVFHDLPKWDDEITVETWSKGTDKLFGLRDFMILSGSGAELVSATSAWLVIDRKTARIQRIDLENSDFPVKLDRHAIETKLGKIEERETRKSAFDHVVRYTDIDVNKHVNSSKYLQWILDSFGVDYLGKKSLKSFEINFLAEAQLNDMISVSTGAAGDHFYCDVRRVSDNAKLCRANLVWE